MSSIKINSYSVTKSKSGQYTPVINEVHLHSSYNPQKEAQAFVEKNLDLILEKPNLLILGLGFGYHVNLISKLLKKSEHTSFRIMIIEPNKRTHSDCRNLNLLDTTNTTVYSGMDIQSLYRCKDITRFLLNSPNVLAHPASFNLYRDYFSDFLSFRSDRSFKDISKRVNTELANYLEANQTDTLDRLLLTEVEKKPELTEAYDYIMLAFKNMAKVRPNAGDNL